MPANGRIDQIGNSEPRFIELSAAGHVEGTMSEKNSVAYKT
ncbi:MAG: hypothetical protein ACLQBQ_08365 [Smithella sp.]